jgi:hypothetical protein
MPMAWFLGLSVRSWEVLEDMYLAPKQKRDRQAGLQRKHELELAKVTANNELMRDIVRYIGEDIRSQLLIVALTGTSLSMVISAYKSYVQGVQDKKNAPIKPGAPEVEDALPLFLWLMSGGPGGALGGMLSVAELFQPSTLGPATTPWGIIDGMRRDALTVSGLAWGALYASIILGEGGLGGLLDKAGGGGFGALASTAVI